MLRRYLAALGIWCCIAALYIVAAEIRARGLGWGTYIDFTWPDAVRAVLLLFMPPALFAALWYAARRRK